MSLYVHKVGAGPQLVLLHGWGMNAAVWEPLLPGLGERFTVTVIELPGHGGSAPAPRADLGAWAGLCLDAAPPTAHWIGWSLGAQVALAAALAAPTRVAGLTLVGATPRFVQAPDWPVAMPVETFRQFAASLGKDPGATLLRFLALQVRGAEHERETLRLLRDELAKRPPACAEGLAQGLRLLLETDLRPRLAQLACPSHWIYGARDTLAPAALCAEIARLLPDARCDVVAGAGHAPFLSHPGRSLELLLDQPVIA